ncbi:uroporphyrinogen-III C-methyltransferase [Brasilonema octagenarum UFV-E1]|uniref:uroporphyrinogen-III C-methyltransferase n=2 Tax=Brasilonema TaxID=383614 RepID=A0A856M8R2_9CYAN|nr:MULTISPECIES: uroporphyrinogen-III C-methyltransferase [Brasilonema]NMF64569.1 uroporphyrinogen-III C-methyltransferase [Brasilonema octagenarum UFV-OR1]QDL07553.1 uroporphyrinogen-III C-methyltransferase [Brasilonema sennae CENA114]QDL13915.1 uroporphyrinogen-III C-methyltransferase [Brasilonema octagenarum UFV-E1]
MAEQRGKVYIVGAGPGDIGYLTLKAYRLLSSAEVLVYDALVDPELLQCVPPDCLKLNVGKRGGQASTPQAEINQLMVKYCQHRKQVIRLKSGDPFIFGRCSSEIEALKAAGCEFEVIPGISSAIAAPLLAGIPLSDPVMSRCFAVFTAHDPDALDWEALSRLETLVILMGGQHLGDILHRLVRQGRSRLTPIAIIRWAGTPQQTIWTGTLENILEQTSGVSLSPAVIVIGEVVGLRSYLQPEKISLDNSSVADTSHPETMQTNLALSSSSRPLTGKTIVVTRAAGHSNQFTQTLTSFGANVIEMPTLEIGPPSSWQGLDHAIAHISEFHWLILTSTNGVGYFFERLFAQGKDARALSQIKIAVVGEKTAQRLNQHSLQPDFIPPNFVADSLVENFPEELTGKKVLFPRVESGGREILVQQFTAKGAEVIEVAAYQSCCPKSVPPSAELALESGTVDVITFASSKTVQFFHQLAQKIFSEDSQNNPSLVTDAFEGVCIASIGPQTSKTCHSIFGRVDVEAEEYTLDGLTQALIKWATHS